MITPVLMIEALQRNTLDAGFAAAFGRHNWPCCQPNQRRQLPVNGSAMDFRMPKAIGRDADNGEPCVEPFRGYDSNFVIGGHPVATAIGDQTGITMVMDTDQPGVQLYTANAMTDRKGKGGKNYGFRSAFCLETQHYPDRVHHPAWPTTVLKKGASFRSITTYTFPNPRK